MAQRRMFSKTITNSGKFLKMPPTSRLLYYDLGMNADDDGYTEWFTIVRMSGSTEQDLKVLQANGFVKIFDENVLVILDWKENNYIQKDRYTPSKYLTVYNMDTVGIPNVNTGKVRLGKDRIDKDTTETSSDEINQLIKSFEDINPACKSYYARPPQRKACSDLISVYGFDRVKIVIEKTLPKTNTLQYFPKITTPIQLWEKWSTLENAVKGYQSEKQIKNNVAF